MTKDLIIAALRKELARQIRATPKMVRDAYEHGHREGREYERVIQSLKSNRKE